MVYIKKSRKANISVKGVILYGDSLQGLLPSRTRAKDAMDPAVSLIA